MITVDLSDKHALANISGQKLSTLQLSALRQFLTYARKAVPVAGQVSVLLTSDSEIRKLNRVFRRSNRATDVISFPALIIPERNKAQSTGNHQRQDGIAGDLAISVDTAERQAKGFGHPLNVELKILILHGLLHLAGYDHETDDGEMANREEQLRRRFRLPGALIARSLNQCNVENLPARSPRSRGRA